MIVLHTHTCSELSLRILLWNASYMQKTLPGIGQRRDPKRHQGATIAIASVVSKLKMLEIYPNDRHAGSRLFRLP